MIQPEAYYAAHKECRTPEELGRLGFIIVGRADELTPPPSSIELSFARTLSKCNEWHNENREALKDKWRRQKKEQRAKDNGGQPMSTDVHECPQDKGGQPMSTTSLSLSPSLTHSLTHSNNNNNHSVSVPVKGVQDERNDNGTDDLFSLGGFVEDFKRALIADPTGSAFFDPAHDPAVIAIALTGDKKSQRRWRQAMNKIGEGAMRDELFSFYRELKSGEVPNNRGAALNARLKKMEGGK